MIEKAFTRRHFIAYSAAAFGGLVLCGCSGTTKSSSTGTSSGSSASSAASSSDAADTAKSPSSAPASSAETASQSSSAGSKGGKVLVACFSATGNTRAVAQAAATRLGADYFEIEAAVPYTAEDLDYGDETTRATAEQNDPAARPSVAATPDFSAYDAVLIGHPIWWGKAPRLICTLLESANLAGKKVAEFCTSGSSGVEAAAAELKGLTSGADWVGERRFAAGASESEIANWVDSLDLG